MTGNYTIIKRYADNYYSVTQLHRDKPCGVMPKVEFDSEYIYPQPTDCLPNFVQLSLQHEECSASKLRESLSRSRNLIFEKAMCNEWDYFFTGTIDPKKYDRYDLNSYYKNFSQYILDLRKRHGIDIKYIFIPEMHKDGAWHLHGLISGLPKRPYLRLFNLDEKLPKYIRKKLKQGFEVFNWSSYFQKFGFCDLEPIRNKEACCKYIVKYITKDLDRSVKEAHAKTYYCSKGLNRAQIIYAGEDTERISLPDCSTVYMDRKSFFTFAEAFEYANIQFYDSFINSGLDDDTIQRILSA